MSLSPAQIKSLAEDLFANVNWRNDVNEAAGRKLTVKQMFDVAMAVAEKVERLTAEQDGADFYDAVSGRTLTSYPNVVNCDFDMEGAAEARRMFLRDYPEYVMSEEI